MFGARLIKGAKGTKMDPMRIRYSKDRLDFCAPQLSTFDVQFSRKFSYYHWTKKVIKFGLAITSV
jgi:hypothetical protein